MERKMMMFNNHCHAHLKHLINLRNIHTDFLPPSTKEPLQHMAQGMIRVRSNSGRSWCVNCFNNLNQDPSTILSTLPILDALHFFSMCNNRLLCNCYVLSQSRLRLWCCRESECTNRQTVVHTCPHENLNLFSTFESFVNTNGPSSDLWWGKYWKYATGQPVNQELERNEEQHAHDKS